MDSTGHITHGSRAERRAGGRERFSPTENSMQIVHTCEEYDKYPPPRSEAGYILLMITALLLGPAMIYCICKAEAAKRAHGERSVSAGVSRAHHTCASHARAAVDTMWAVADALVVDVAHGAQALEHVRQRERRAGWHG